MEPQLVMDKSDFHPVSKEIIIWFQEFYSSKEMNN